MSTAFPLLGPDDLPAIAALCRRGLADPPSEQDLRSSLFTPGFPVLVRGDPKTGVVASCTRNGSGYLRLVVVDPDSRRHGLGDALLSAAEADLSGAESITVGADAPDYLVPGVETTQLEMLCLLERRRYARTDANFNMTVDLSQLPPEPPEPHVARPDERAEIEAWITVHWAFWTTEVLRCAERQRLMISRDDQGIAAVCCWDGARTGWVGPVAVRPAAIGHGLGRSVLIAALHRMRAAGSRRAEIGWVGPIRPYAHTVGATVQRVFFVYRKNQAITDAVPSP